MLDLTQYDSLGATLSASVEHWPAEVCLIEADRERERGRLTYREFGEAALKLAAALQESGFAAGDRAAILMTNQSKWLISAYAVFYCGGVLVPLDYKLTPPEQMALLAHSKARVVITEYPIWRGIAGGTESQSLRAETVLVTEAPSGADLGAAKRWEEFQGKSLNFAIVKEKTWRVSSIPPAPVGGPRAAC